AGSTTGTTPGGQSWFGSAATVLANGGGSVANNSTVGGAGGAPGIGAVTYSGGTGANDPAGNAAGGGGSSAGTNANGTNATGNAGATAPAGGGNGGAGASSGNNPGIAGSVPGGGGGGARKQSGGSTPVGGAGANGQVQITYTEQIPTPVKLKLFTASRKQANVELSWVTAMEQNNSGFELQRQSGAGGWQTLAFVASLSADGNSNSDLSYFYNDANNSKGVTQYRLKQVDLDNKYEFSQVRAVHGMSQSGRTLVAPNPSGNGSLNVLFETAGERDLLLTDMAGRIMRQWNNYADNSLQISNLAPGNYQLRIIDRETKTQSVEKIMVTNR
ncbi:MAG: T9SS type A sorting domain-containing protein, partial [Flavisolibacter sp.]|nr:T9SS type A sorting domain-containing protein [Flavisolibacter sp.]